MYLKASAAGRGCCAAGDIALLELDKDASAEMIVGAVVHARPDLVGLSCYVWNIKTTIAAARTACSSVRGRVVNIPPQFLSGVCRSRVRRARVADPVSDTNHVDHGGDPVNADDVGAQQHAGRDRRRRSPLAR